MRGGDRSSRWRLLRVIRWWRASDHRRRRWKRWTNNDQRAFYLFVRSFAGKFALLVHRWIVPVDPVVHRSKLDDAFTAREIRIARSASSSSLETVEGQRLVTSWRKKKKSSFRAWNPRIRWYTLFLSGPYRLALSRTRTRPRTIEPNEIGTNLRETSNEKSFRPNAKEKRRESWIFARSPQRTVFLLDFSVFGRPACRRSIVGLIITCRYKLRVMCRRGRWSARVDLDG